MNAQTFIKFWQIDLENLQAELESFASNMDHIAKKDDSFLDRSYVDWIETWMAWAELSSTEDIKNSFDPFDNMEETAKDESLVFLT